MKILYFAWLREKVGVAEEEVSLPEHVADLAGLVEWLRTRSPGHADALADTDNVRFAVNLDHARLDHAVAQGDEVALFPPMTGG